MTSERSPRRAITTATRAAALLLSLAMATSGEAQFEADIARWTAQDALAAPEEGAILFVGSSGIRRWEQLALDFADYNILQRGFGGAQFDDVNRYVDDIVIPYSPRAIVVWAGTNDLGVGDDGAEVIADYDTFVSTVQSALPSTDIFYLGIMPTPGRLANGPQETIANIATATREASDPRLHYVDLPAAFQALNPPDDEAFQNKFVDSIHLNRAGYDLWTSVIRPQVEAVLAPNKAFTPNTATLRPGEKLLFDFGPSNPEDGDPTLGPDDAGNLWNNWHPATGGVAVNAGERITNLVSTSGRETGIDLTITGGFVTNGKANGGLLAPDRALLGDLAVATATQDYFFSTADGVQGGGNDDVPAGFMLDGLNPNLAYDLRLFGSRLTTARRVTEYVAVGAETDLTNLQTSGFRVGADGYDGNNNQTALLAGVRPDRFGQVFIDITLADGAFAYINAMEVTAVIPEPTAALSAAAATGVAAMAAPPRTQRRSR